MPRCGRGGNRQPFIGPRLANGARFAKSAKVQAKEQARAEAAAEAIDKKARRRGIALAVKAGEAGFCLRCGDKLGIHYMFKRTGEVADLLGDSYGPYCPGCCETFEATILKAFGNAVAHFRKYGIPVAQYAHMYARQHGKCAICKDVTRTGARGLVIDHDHETGAVRALLCSRCNSAIGLLGDDPRIVGAATTYLLEHHARRSA